MSFETNREFYYIADHQLQCIPDHLKPNIAYREFLSRPTTEELHKPFYRMSANRSIRSLFYLHNITLEDVTYLKLKGIHVTYHNFIDFKILDESSLYVSFLR